MVPWQSQDEWRQIKHAFTRVEKCHSLKFEYLIKLAGRLKDRYGALSDPMGFLCEKTCPRCEDVCCERATVWYDFADLLFIYLAFKSLPEHQIYRTADRAGKKKCCFFSPVGCALPRIERPFICTWYFCPEQSRVLARHHPEIKIKMDTVLSEIKSLRRKIEAGFIYISAGKGREQEHQILHPGSRILL